MPVLAPSSPYLDKIELDLKIFQNILFTKKTCGKQSDFLSIHTASNAVRNSVKNVGICHAEKDN